MDEIDIILEEALFKNYLDKLSEFKVISGKEYFSPISEWHTRHTNTEISYLDTNCIEVRNGCIKYTKHNPMGFIVESFEFNLNDYRNKQLDKILCWS